MSSLEQTLSIIKPDAVERNLIEKIKDFFTKNNLKIFKEKKVKILKLDTPESLAKRIIKVENKLYPAAITKVLSKI